MGTKFKMPAHPMFRNGEDLAVSFFLEIAKENRVSFFTKEVGKITKDPKSVELFVKSKGQSIGDEHRDFGRNMGTFYSESILKCDIAESGYNLFKIEGNQWDETVSRKTIEQIKAEDFALPLPAMAIDLSGVDWAGEFDLALVGVIPFMSQLVIRFENKDHQWYVVFLPLDTTISKGLSLVDIDEEKTEIVYKVLSLVMYASMFKRDKNRYVTREVKARNSKYLKKYRVSETRLIQPEYALHGKSIGKRGGNTVAFMVRGHWRTQPIGPRSEKKTKVIWVAPFPKGEGREALQKVYKIK